jgi:hypothetical protein
MALDKITSQSIADGAITVNDIADGAITHSKLHTTAIQDKLGYTPANEANPTFTGQSITIPAGTTAERPESPVNGMLRFNTTLGKLEQYDGFDWSIIDAPPVVLSITPSTELASDDPQSIVITGSNFSTTVFVKLIGNDGITEYTPTTVVRNSSTQITITFAGNDRITGVNEPYDVLVTNSTGLFGILENALNINDVPTWITPSGSLGTVIEDVTMSNITLSATDPESVGITYSVASGALPIGVSLASNGVISGTPNVNDSYNSSGVIHNFTVGASDGAQSTNRSFSILRHWLDGEIESRAALSANNIKNLTGTTTDGSYWIKPLNSPTAFLVHCYMSIEGGGWMLVLRNTSNELGPFSSGSFLVANWEGWGYNTKSQIDTLGFNYSTAADTNCFTPVYAHSPFSDVMVIANRSGQQSKRVGWRHSGGFNNMHSVISTSSEKVATSVLFGNAYNWLSSLDIRSDTNVGGATNTRVGFKIRSDTGSSTSASNFTGGFWTSTMHYGSQIGCGRESTDANVWGGGFGGNYNNARWHRLNGHWWNHGDGRNSSAWNAGDQSSGLFGHAVYVR